MSDTREQVQRMSNATEETHTTASAPEKYRCIGKGFCGSVWALEEGRALKREDGGPGRSIQNDYIMHQNVLNAFSDPTLSQQLQRSVAIPNVYDLIQDSDSEWWKTRGARFPTGYVPCRSLLSEQIPHFPKHVRDRLIDEFCPRALQDCVRSNPADEHCLVRPYLGRRRRNATNCRFQRFSLRNYPMHIDQMVHLGLDISGYARAMGAALAIIYWSAHIDANDIEFVLAPITKGKPLPNIFHSDVLGEHTLWVLDFDCCRTMTMDEKGVEQACNAFFRNDPFYPRLDNLEYPNEAGGLDVWHIFRASFLVMSRHILEEQDFWLAKRLMDMIERVAETKRKEKKLLAEAQDTED